MVSNRYTCICTSLIFVFEDSGKNQFYTQEKSNVIKIVHSASMALRQAFKILSVYFEVIGPFGL